MKPTQLQGLSVVFPIYIDMKRSKYLITYLTMIICVKNFGRPGKGKLNAALERWLINRLYSDEMLQDKYHR